MLPALSGIMSDNKFVRRVMVIRTGDRMVVSSDFSDCPGVQLRVSTI